MRGKLERRFNAAFDTVRWHRDPTAAGNIDASAFATGEHVVLGVDTDPHSAAGLSLIAHELTHVLQQRRTGPVPADAPPTGRQDAAEREAEAAAAAVISGQRPAPVREPPHGLPRAPKPGVPPDPDIGLTRRDMHDLAPTYVENLFGKVDYRSGYLISEGTEGSEGWQERYWSLFWVDGNGTMRASVRLVNPERTARARTMKSLPEQFGAALAWFRGRGVRVLAFEGDWSYMNADEPSSNLAVYQREVAAGRGSAEAAGATPSGRAAVAAGFTEISVAPTVVEEQEHLPEGVARPRVKATFRIPGFEDAGNRLAGLARAEEILDRYGRFVRGSEQLTEQVRRTRSELEAALDAYVRAKADGSPEEGTAREQARRRLDQLATEELLPVTMARLTELARLGPHLERFEGELLEARRTGRMSEAGIDALWEIAPDTARRLVRSSRLPRREQARLFGSLPGAVPGGGTRVTAGFLIALEMVNLVAPLVEQERAHSADHDVGAALRDIMWWQDKGVAPTMKAVDDNLAPFWSNEETTDRATIQKWLDDHEVGFLALTGIEGAPNWDRFGIWATTHLLNYGDWQEFIERSTAVRGTGPYLYEREWSYRTATIESHWYDFEVREIWNPDKQLTKILRSAAQAMVRRTEREIALAAVAPGRLSGPGTFLESADRSTEAFVTLPRATGRKRFRHGIGEPTLYTSYQQHARTGFAHDALLYTFPDRAALGRGEVPDGYVVVGGADFNTYVAVYNTLNVVSMATDHPIIDRVPRNEFPNRSEMLLARSGDLEDAPTERP